MCSNLIKILPAWLKLMLPSIVRGATLWLAYGIVSSLKLQWIEEDALGGR